MTDYETEIIDGHKAVVRHFFEPHISYYIQPIRYFDR